MPRRSINRVVLASAASMALASSFAQADIGVNFRRGSGEQLMDAVDVAGFVPQANWNNSDGAAVGSLTNILGGALLDDVGAASGASLNWRAATTWSANNGTASGDAKLFGGYIDNNSGNPITFVDVSSIPYAHYDVYAYLGSDGNGRTGTVAVIGQTPVGFSTFSMPFTGYVTAPGGPSTYVKFAGLTESSLRLANLRGSNNSGIHGFQIVERTDPAPTPPAHVTPNLLAYYSFDTDTSDASGNGNNLTPQAEASIQPGVFGNSLTLDGTGDRAVLPSAPAGLKPTGTLTISAFVKRQSANASEIVSLGDHYGLRINANGTVHFFFDSNPTANGWTGLTTDAAQADEIIANDSVWHHIVAQKTPTHLEVWIDGVLANGATAQWPTVAPIDYAQLGNDFRVGSHGASDANFHTGMIDEVRIFDGALSPDEIQSLFLSNVVPEPSSLMLLAAGALAPLARRRRS